MKRSSVIFLFFIFSCSTGNPELQNFIGIELPPRHISCTLGRNACHIPLDHFVFKYSREIGYKENTIKISGHFIGNQYRKKLPDSDQIWLRNIKVYVLFLDSSRTIIKTEKFHLEYSPGQYPGIFDEIPFSIELPFNLEFVHISFSYNATIEWKKKPERWSSDAYN